MLEIRILGQFTVQLDNIAVEIAARPAQSLLAYLLLNPVAHRRERLAGLRLNLSSILATLQAQNLVRPSGTMQTQQERVFLRVTGAFDTDADIESPSLIKAFNGF